MFAGSWGKWTGYKAYLDDRAGQLYRSNAGSAFSDQFKVSFDSLLAERGWRRAEFKDFGDFMGQIEKTGGWWDATQLRERQIPNICWERTGISRKRSEINTRWLYI
jgi:hypothetical protein